MNGAKTKKIVLTGPECSGKTTLSVFLANRLRCALVGEMAREYLDQRPDTYHLSDLVAIATQQELAIRHHLKTPGTVIMDTAFLEIMIWARVKFNSVIPWIEELFYSFQPDLYLLCRPDIPWVSDPLRESPEERDALFLLYKAFLESAGKPFLIIEGDFEERKSTALKSVSLY